MERVVRTGREGNGNIHGFSYFTTSFIQYMQMFPWQSMFMDNFI